MDSLYPDSLYPDDTTCLPGTVHPRHNSAAPMTPSSSTRPRVLAPPRHQDKTEGTQPCPQLFPRANRCRAIPFRFSAVPEDGRHDVAWYVEENYR
ncbi:hypothetical protein ACIPSA_47665 [Streptomyces sp. NPDC086549]|uniref:hypothetical protein n=1 Tax=Streptomyces sp. NPDC086549 TaxID=3365752 RepID=UPI0038061A0E